MIALLKGLVEGTGTDWVIVDVGGVGYKAFCSQTTLGRLHKGQPCRLVIETHVREDHIHLYGFADDNEHAWFLKLSAVQGVGGKVALAILSVLDAHSLPQAIAAQDKAAFTRADGVGPKLALRLVTELKDKAMPVALSAPSGVTATKGCAGDAQDDSALNDALSALVNLGYARLDAYQAVMNARGEGIQQTGALVTRSLQLLSG